MYACLTELALLFLPSSFTTRESLPNFGQSGVVSPVIPAGCCVSVAPLRTYVYAVPPACSFRSA